MSMSHMEKSHNKIESLQALRAIAFIGIFLMHAGSPYKWPALGVVIFFVMSGFLMTYRHMDDELDYSIKGRLVFSIKRIKKLYLLHILTMICAIFLEIYIGIKHTISLHSWMVLGGEIFLHTLLVQTWVPHSTICFSLNGVAWFLSVAMFLYFMFPIIQRFIKNKKIKDLWGMCFIVLVFQWGSCIPVIRFFGEDSTVYTWFMYCFPIFRIGDFFVGCTLGKQFAEIESHRLGFIQTSIIEVFMTLITIGVFAWLKIEQDNIFILALHNWTTIFIPIATIWTYLFAVNNGVVTRIFTNKVFLFIGNISAYTYLIHNVITRYTNTVFEFLNIGVPINIQWGVILIEFIITILFAMLYIRLRVEKNVF